MLGLVFTEKIDKAHFNTIYNPLTPEESLTKFEKKLTDRIIKLDKKSYYSIENLILEKNKDFKNLKQAKGIEEIKKIFPRKYEKDDGLHESVLIHGKPMFIRLKNDSIEFVDYVEESNFAFHPSDNITTHNPKPYSFVSEKNQINILSCERIIIFLLV